MKESFAAYPEVLFVDATYKLLHLRAPVFILMVEDGNGASVIVGVGILTSESIENVQWLFDTLKARNSCWE